MRSIAKGARFGLWTTLREREPGEPVRSKIPCRCDCGTEKPVRIDTLFDGTSVRCKRHHDPIHGECDTPEYHAWENMIARCNNPRHAAYKWYGGRGIKVCEGWHSPITFLADMGTKPSAKMELDRPDNNGGYWCGHCPECVTSNHIRNGRWTTNMVQHSNTRKNVYLTHDGATLHISEWARRIGITRGSLSKRIRKGWSVSRAVTEPKGNDGGH